MEVGNILSPVIVFVYNRLEHTKNCINSLLANKDSCDSELFIYSDAPKSDSDAKAVVLVREYIKTVKGFKSVSIVEREHNCGLANNIMDGVSQIVEKYGRVIVVEDDLVVSPYFLKFMNDALFMYAEEEKVGHIQACDFTNNPDLPDTFLIKWTGSWGWATWDRAWRLFNPDGKYLLSELERKKLTKTFDFNGRYGYTRMLRRQTEGKNDSWAIRWNASLFLNNVLSLNVGKSLVQNMGFDGTGTNCGGGGLYRSLLYDKSIPVVKISPIEENRSARHIYEKYYAKTNSFFAKAVRRIRRTMKMDFGR